jgi:hypothetical protein
MTNARRKLAIVGVVGLAAVLGSGAYVLTDRLAGDKPTATSEPVAVAPVTPATQSESTEPSATPSATPKKSAVRAPKSEAPSPAAAVKSPADRAKAAREAGRKTGVKVQPPLPQSDADPSITPADLTVTQTGNLVKDRAMMTVVSARKNLAGYRELGWVADDGEQVGDARCSQTFRFSAGSKPAERPTYLVCWRTSANRSVYTTATDLVGRPSKTASVAAIDRQWQRLG